MISNLDYSADSAKKCSN